MLCFYFTKIKNMSYEVTTDCDNFQRSHFLGNNWTDWFKKKITRWYPAQNPRGFNTLNINMINCLVRWTIFFRHSFDKMCPNLFYIAFLTYSSKLKKKKQHDLIFRGAGRELKNLNQHGYFKHVRIFYCKRLKKNPVIMGFFFLFQTSGL